MPMPENIKGERWKGKAIVTVEHDTVELVLRHSPYPGDYKLKQKDIDAIAERLGKWARQLHMFFVAIPAEEESDGD